MGGSDQDPLAGSGGYPQGGGRPPREDGRHRQIGGGQYSSGGGSGRHPREGVGQHRQGGPSARDEGGWNERDESGRYPRAGGGRSGRYAQSGSGQYARSSGSHRIVHNKKPRRRLAAVLLGAMAGVAACILAIFVVLGMSGGEQESGGVANSGATGAETTEAGERTVVPDACETVSDGLADELAPDADRTQSDTYQSSDRQNQCVWGAYTSKEKRVLTVELRAVAGAGGRSGAEVAGQMFQGEREADESGEALLDGHELAEKRTVEDVGDEAYVVYTVDSGQDSGEAVVNVRTDNVLITVHYAGTNDGEELGADPAIDGALAAAKETLAALNQGG